MSENQKFYWFFLQVSNPPTIKSIKSIKSINFSNESEKFFFCPGYFFRYLFDKKGEKIIRTPVNKLSIADVGKKLSPKNDWPSKNEGQWFGVDLLIGLCILAIYKYICIYIYINIYKREIESQWSVLMPARLCIGSKNHAWKTKKLWGNTNCHECMSTSCALASPLASRT